MTESTPWTESTSSASGPDIAVSVCPGGPMLVRGASEVTGPDGEAHEVRRRVVAVCRCEKSALYPWCDGTHKILPARLRPDEDSVPSGVELR